MKSYNKRAPKLSQGTVTRAFTAEVGVTEGNSIELSISSDIPYLRQFGYEVLSHDPAAVDMSRLLNGAAVRDNHDGPQVGVVENAWIDGGKLRATIRFSQGVLGSEIEQDVIDGIRKNVSIGYQIMEWDKPSQRSEMDGIPVFTATKWQPYHVAFVPDPADYTVGVGRSLTPQQVAALEDILATAKMDMESDGMMENVVETPEEDTADAVEESPTVEVTVEVEVPCEPSDEEMPDMLVAGCSPTEKEIEEITLEDIPINNTGDESVSTKAGMVLADNNQSATSQTFSQETNPMQDNVTEVVNPNIKLTEKEQKLYSLSRAIMTLGSNDRSGFEMDISQEIARQTGRDTQGFFMPTSVRAFSVGDSATGGALTLTQPGEFIDYLRNRAVVAQLGAQVMNLPGKVALPRMGGDIAATWVSEDGAGTTISSASLDQLVLSPKKMIAYTGYSLETLRVANYSIDAIVTDNMYKSLTTAFDKAAIQGTGTTQPVGLVNTAGLGSGSFSSGSALTYAACVAAWSVVAQGNGDLNNMAFLTTPQVVAAAATIIRSGSTKDFIMTDDKRIFGYDCAVSNNVPTANGAHYLFFGDWSSLILAEFGAIEVTTDPFTSKHKGLIEVSAALLGDVGIKTIKSFSVVKGIAA